MSGKVKLKALNTPILNIRLSNSIIFLDKRLKPNDDRQLQHRRRKSSGSQNIQQDPQTTTTAVATVAKSKSDRSNVKSEPVEGSNYYSSQFSGTKTLHDPSLHGLPQLTPAPFSTHHHHQHYHQGFSVNDDVKYHSGNPHSSLPYPHHGYGSFHSNGANGSNSASGIFYPGLPEHSAKLNLQAS